MGARTYQHRHRRRARQSVVTVGHSTAIGNSIAVGGAVQGAADKLAGSVGCIGQVNARVALEEAKRLQSEPHL